jgi:hypothetical protein
MTFEDNNKPASTHRSNKENSIHKISAIEYSKESLVQGSVDPQSKNELDYEYSPFAVAPELIHKDPNH